MPAEPVPEMGKVTALRVLHTARSCSCSASITLMQCGSRCPSVGRLMALSTLGATGLGPGAIKSTWSSVPKTVVMTISWFVCGASVGWSSPGVCCNGGCATITCMARQRNSAAGRFRAKG